MLVPLRGALETGDDAPAALASLVRAAASAASCQPAPWSRMLHLLSDPHMFKLVRSEATQAYTEFLDVTTRLFTEASVADPEAAATFCVAAIDGFAFLPMLGLPMPTPNRLMEAARPLFTPPERSTR